MIRAAARLGVDLLRLVAELRRRGRVGVREVREERRQARLLLRDLREWRLRGAIIFKFSQFLDCNSGVIVNEF